MNNIAQAIYIERIRQGMTQKTLAIKSGVPQPNISHIEKGRDFKVSTFCQIAAALEMRPADLLEGARPLSLNKKRLFMRDNLERVAACLAGKKLPLPVSAEFQSVIKLLEPLVGKRKGYVRKKDLYLAWAAAKKTFSREELNAIWSRLSKSEKRTS